MMKNERVCVNRNYRVLFCFVFMREEKRKKSAMGLVCVNVRKLREGERDKVERISVSFGYSEEAIAKTSGSNFDMED